MFDNKENFREIKNEKCKNFKRYNIVMKKILVLHNRYRILGGEDTAVENEIEFLSEIQKKLFFQQ